MNCFVLIHVRGTFALVDYEDEDENALIDPNNGSDEVGICISEESDATNKEADKLIPGVKEKPTPDIEARSSDSMLKPQKNKEDTMNIVMPEPLMPSSSLQEEDNRAWKRQRYVSRR